LFLVRPSFTTTTCSSLSVLDYYYLVLFGLTVVSLVEGFVFVVTLGAELGLATDFDVEGADELVDAVLGVVVGLVVGGTTAVDLRGVGVVIFASDVCDTVFVCVAGFTLELNLGIDGFLDGGLPAVIATGSSFVSIQCLAARGPKNCNIIYKMSLGNGQLHRLDTSNV
jgi:hypothetical protein